jgi:hypothetical protein
MTGVLFEPPLRSSFWTAEAGLRHSEGFRVESPSGPVGYVEEVLLDDADEDVKALLVYDTAGRRRVPVAAIAWVDVARELIRLVRAE